MYAFERYTFIWIEGWELLQEYCLKRFKRRPDFCECTGTCGLATIHNIYKADKDGHYHDMYFMYMEHPKGEYTNWFDLQENVENKWDYEQIKADRRSILKR